MAKLQTATVIRSFLPFTGYRSSGHRSRINSLAIPLQNRSRSLSPSTVKSKYAHGLFPYLRLDCRRLLPVPWDLCRRFSDSSARPIPQHLWQHRPVHRATPRQRRTTSERRHPALAPQRFLDAGRPVLHAVDDRSISVDLLRSVSSPGPAGHVPRRHHFFRLRRSPDGCSCASSAFETQRNSSPFRIHRFYSAAFLVDLSLCLCRASLDISE